MGKSVNTGRNMMWPATFLPFVYGLGLQQPPKKKQKRQQRLDRCTSDVTVVPVPDISEHDVSADPSASDVTVAPVSDSTWHDLSSNSSSVSEHNGHEDTSASDCPDPVVEQFAEASQLEYSHGWPFSHFRRQDVSSCF